MFDSKLTLNYGSLSVCTSKRVLDYAHKILVYPRIAEHFEIGDYEKFRPYMKASKYITIDEIKKLLGSIEFKKQVLYFKNYSESLYSKQTKKGYNLDTSVLDKLNYYLKINFNYIQAIENYSSLTFKFKDEKSVKDMALIGSRLKTSKGYIQEISTILPFLSKNYATIILDDNMNIVDQAYQAELIRLKEAINIKEKVSYANVPIENENVNRELNQLIKHEIDSTENSKKSFTESLNLVSYKKNHLLMPIPKIEYDYPDTVEELNDPAIKPQVIEPILNLTENIKKKRGRPPKKIDKGKPDKVELTASLKTNKFAERFEESDLNPSTSDVEPEVYTSVNRKNGSLDNISRFANIENEDDTTFKVDDNYLNQLGFQEFSRYFEPSKPFIYQIEDLNGNCFKYYVPPLQLSSKSNNLPLMKTYRNSHSYLVNDRVTSVTLESIIKDACARLPDGAGTIMDITILTIQSVFVKKELPINEFLKIVKETLHSLQKSKDVLIYRNKLNPLIWHYDTQYIKDKYFKSVQLPFDTSVVIQNDKETENEMEDCSSSDKSSLLLRAKRKPDDVVTK